MTSEPCSWLHCRVHHADHTHAACILPGVPITGVSVCRSDTAFDQDKPLREPMLTSATLVMIGWNTFRSSQVG